MKYQRRTDEDRIAELNAKIEGIRERAARKAVRANPAVRQATIALKAMEKAIEAKPEPGLDAALQQAAVALRGALDETVATSEPVQAPPARKRRARAKATATT